MSKKNVTGLVASLTMLMIQVTDSQAIIIDTFDVAQLIVAPPVSIVSGEVSGAGILGTERDVVATAEAGFGATTITVDEFGSSLLGYEQDWDKGTGLLTWDGADGSILLDPVGLGGVDLTDGGLSDALAVEIAFIDSDVTLSFTIHTDGTNHSSWSGLVPGTTSPGTFMISFLDFVTSGGTGADFQNVGAIEMGIAGVTGTDVQISLLSTVPVLPIPEPGTFLLTASGLLALFFRRAGTFHS